MRWNTTILCIVICLIPISSHAATVYKWTDDNGNVHYSQIKPKNVPSIRMRISATSQQNKSTYKRPSLNKKDADGSQNNEQNANKKAARKKSAHKEDSGCKAAKSNLQTLFSSGRVRVKDKDGNLSYMSDEQKQQRIKQEKDFIKRSCK